MLNHLIREAKPEDAQGIAEAHIASKESTYRGLLPDEHLAKLSVPERAEKWRSALLKNEDKVFAALVGSKLVGFVCMGRSKEPGFGEVFAMYLLEDFQRQGIGTSLWSEATKHLKELGFTTIKVWVLETNHKARSFYERLGCTLDGARETKKFGEEERVVVRYEVGI